MHALIEADGLTKKFGKVQALAGLTLTLPAGRAGGHPRAQRCRQDHLHPHGGHADRARPRHAAGRRPRRGARPHGGAAHDRPGRPVGRGRGDDDRAGEPGDGGPPLRPGPRRRRRPRARRGSSSRWTWSTRPTASSRPTRAACAGGSTSGPAWSARRACCCSTSRRRGLDPGSRNEVWDGIRAMGRAGTDILLTTQYLDEADHLAGAHRHHRRGSGHRPGHARRAQVPGGRRHGRAAHRRRADHAAGRRGARRRSAWPSRPPTRPPAAARWRRPAAPKLLPIVVRALDDAAVAVEDIALRRPTLDEVFLALTGHTTTDRPDHPKEDAA